MKWWALSAALFFLFGCQDYIEPRNVTDVESDVQITESDYSVSDAVILGEKLFFDPRLSKNGNISCSSCHLPQFAFSDTVPVSRGTNGELGFRNSPSIVNVADKERFHKDGGVRTMELQILAPITDSMEMGGDFLRILEILSADKEYLNLFKLAFDTTPSVYGITRAIAAYEKSLNYYNSPYDRFVAGDSSAMSQHEINGMNLFFSERLNCTSCHSGNLFTDFSYQNIGLEHQENDSGRARITMLPEDAGKFEVPTLRNVSVTGPYMHNGSFVTLDEVIRYLEIGGGVHRNKSELIQPFSLTDEERKDVIAFLDALTDDAFRK